MLGIDGDWVRKELLTDNDIDLVSHDLEKPITIKNTYDLAISLEVGEHLSSDLASSFISDICKTSNRVLFSAAIPGQEGNNPTHINEQWQSYWCSLFKMNGYYPLDIVRPTVWKNKRIPIHYRQNTLFYVQGDEYEKLRKTVMPKDTGNEFTSLDVVHPELYFNKISRLGRELGVRESVGIALRIPLALLRSIRHRIIR